MTRATNLLTILALTAIPAFPADRRILISIPDRKILLLEDGHVLKVYDIAVGKPSTPSPQGEFRIVNRIVKPAWYSSGKVVPPGPQNPLGTRWLGLSAPGYGIHGTNSPGSIGKAASHGCIRMRNRDVEELFQLVEVGDAVELRGTRSALAAMGLAAAGE
ncbi:MAG: L,D-transpeptidase [Bryobacterales bacterium]|nr:L,D-transpeptidase [Bryobacterales bacterium]